MWTGFAGPTLLLLDNDIPAELKDAFTRVAFTEAERIVVKPPKTYLPGDTGAEENAWDSYAPAMALALDPTHPRAAAWFKALKIYAVNTYSHPSDRTSDEKIGTDVLKDLISTTNLFDDFTSKTTTFSIPTTSRFPARSSAIPSSSSNWPTNSITRISADEFALYAMHHVKDGLGKNRQVSCSSSPPANTPFPNGSDW